MSSPQIQVPSKLTPVPGRNQWRIRFLWLSRAGFPQLWSLKSSERPCFWETHESRIVSACGFGLRAVSQTACLPICDRSFWILQAPGIRTFDRTVSHQRCPIARERRGARATNMQQTHIGFHLFDLTRPCWTTNGQTLMGLTNWTCSI